LGSPKLILGSPKLNRGLYFVQCF